MVDVVVAMAGRSQRFARAGLQGPKALLDVGGRPMIRRVLELFDPGDRFHVVVSESQVASLPALPGLLRGMAPEVHVHRTLDQDDGVVRSVLAAGDAIDGAAPVLVAYCDVLVDWDLGLARRMLGLHDGLIVTFTGFQPASFGPTMFACCKVEGRRVVAIREKGCFTSDRRGEPAHAGIYGFSSWDLFRRHARELLARPERDLPEVYVSQVYDGILAEGGDVVALPAERFVCLGTPADWEQYRFWRGWWEDDLVGVGTEGEEARGSAERRGGPSRGRGDGARSSTGRPPVSGARVPRVNLVPMAGIGRRFRDEGFGLPKPLIPVRGRPMAQRAIDSLPPSDRCVFAARSEDLGAGDDASPLARLLRRISPGCRIVPVTGPTSGQAATCLAALEGEDPDSEILIASCDYEHTFDAAAWDELRADPGVDGAIWTTRPGSQLLGPWDSFAWCRLAGDGRTVLEIAEKRTISADPASDALAIGTFWFRRASDFACGARAMIRDGVTVGGEHYVGTSIGGLLARGLRFVSFDVRRWVCFGDPFGVRLAEWWGGHFDAALRDQGRWGPPLGGGR